MPEMPPSCICRPELGLLSLVLNAVGWGIGAWPVAALGDRVLHSQLVLGCSV